MCEPERRLDYRMFRHREELVALEQEVAAYLRSPRGRFELWCAARDRTNGAGRQR